MVMKLVKVSKKYQDTGFYIENINLDIKRQEIIGLIGKNGSGKSTLLKILNNLIEIDDGEIYFDHKNIKDFSIQEKLDLRKKVAYIFQNANLLEFYTVYQNLALVYKLSKMKVNKQEIEDILRFMDILEYQHQRVSNLSGGQKQKVAIAMALLQKPEILLCDEISSALDSKSEQEIYQLLANLRVTTNISIVMISHNLQILKDYCDYIYVMDNHSIVKKIIPIKSKLEDRDNYLKYVEDFMYHD